MDEFNSSMDHNEDRKGQMPADGEPESSGASFAKPQAEKEQTPGNTPNPREPYVQRPSQKYGRTAYQQQMAENPDIRGPQPYVYDEFYKLEDPFHNGPYRRMDNTGPYESGYKESGEPYSDDGDNRFASGGSNQAYGNNGSRSGQSNQPYGSGGYSQPGGNQPYGNGPYQQPNQPYGNGPYSQPNQPYGNNWYGRPYEKAKGPVSSVYAYILMALVAVSVVISLFNYRAVFDVMGRLQSFDYSAIITTLQNDAFYMGLALLSQCVTIATVIFLVLDILKISKANYKITGLILFAIFLRPAYFIWRAYILGKKKALPIVFAVFAYGIPFFAVFYISYQMVLEMMYVMP